MKNSAAMSGLQSRYRELLHASRLPDSLLRGDAPAFVRQIDLAFARRLVKSPPMPPEDVFADTPGIVAGVLNASDDGRRLLYASEIALLEQARGAASEFVHRGPFDLLELVLPVRLRGELLHLVRSGPYREQAFRPADLKELAFSAGVPETRVNAAAASVPVVDAAAFDAWAEPFRALQRALEAAMDQHLQAVEARSEQGTVDRQAALGVLAEGLARHFSDLLSVVLGNASLVLDRVDLPADAVAALQSVTEAAQRGRRLTEEVMSGAGSDGSDVVDTSMHERLRGAIHLLESQPGIQLPSLVLRLDAAHDRVVAPPGVAQQIALNLLTVVLDSSGASGIAVSTANEKSADGAERIRIEIRDVAEGAPEGELTTDPQRSMASLRAQVSLADGEMSTAAQGRLQMVVTLPVLGPREKPPEKKVRRRLAPSAIWVADDDPVMRELCRRVLAADGHSIVEYTSGADVRKALGAGAVHADLVVYDFTMPDIDGLELASALREEGRKTPVILISGFGPDHPSIRKALKLRKTYLLQKPFSARDLADMVTIAMGETLVEA